MNWKEVTLPVLERLLATGQAQPLPPEAWPQWARTTPGFSAAWSRYVGGPLATSTGVLSTGNVLVSRDIERKAAQPPQLRYYRFLFVEMTDGRVFQAGPIKDLEYERHRGEGPSWLAAYVTSSTSTG